MSTEAQINANRQNAQKSTGPRTAEGKATVSKNAVKHGLFAVENIINGENPADYEAFHDSLLAEMNPDGIVETLLTERVINLWWRLKRAERMQNQAIDRMIEREVNSPLARHSRKLMCQAQGIPAGDPRCSPNHLPLGRIATKDFSNCRALERMMMYERRIENSVLRIMREYKKQQIMRRLEEQDEAIPKAYGFEAATQLQNGDLKKQSQFVPGMMDISPYKLNGYDDFMPASEGENKANPSGLSMATRNWRTSQSQFDAPFSPEEMLKSEKPPTAVSG